MPPGALLCIRALSTPLSASSSLSPERAGALVPGSPRQPQGPVQALVHSGCLINNIDEKDQPSQGRKGSAVLEILRGGMVFPTGPGEDGEKASGCLERYYREAGLAGGRPEFKARLCYVYLKLSE